MSEVRAGCRQVETKDKQTGERIPLLVFYPSAGEESARGFGPYTVDAVWDAPIATGGFPLVLISHGSGGSPLTLRTLALFLARNGYVVAAPEHPRNNRQNNELAGTKCILGNRPRHLRMAADWAFSELGACLTGDVAAIGHSLGGYTALALAGGKPRSFDWESADHMEYDIDAGRDDRLKALVLLAPATVWFRQPGAFNEVRAAILILTGEKDQVTPPFHAKMVEAGIEGVEHRVIGNAGHFSFLSPFPDAMVRPEFDPSQDPAGFDRAAFHEEMNADILDFLRRVL